MAMANGTYAEFLRMKTRYRDDSGFDPLWLHDDLFDFQRHMVAWAIKRGRAAIFADCGLGKTPMQLVWAENIRRKTNQSVLILTPLAVAGQTLREGAKFGIECKRSHDGKFSSASIVICNYEQLHHFSPKDFAGVVCDESSILKNFDGKRKGQITEFVRTVPYRLLCTATAAPNDYIELGTSSESLGELGFMDMLTRYFKNEANTIDTKRKWQQHGGMSPKWRFKHHAEIAFWRWVCSWARAMRKPSDLGFDDGPFILPPLIEQQSIVENTAPLPGELFVRPAQGLWEQRQELRLSLKERCERAAALVATDRSAVIWCNLNAEGDLLAHLIDDAVQIQGSDSQDRKEEALLGFADGSIRVLITKPRIAGFGMNWQHCAHVVVFPSHSFEQYYQSVRRCWRFGQTQPVTVDVVTTGGGVSVLANLQRKAKAADKMFDEITRLMGHALNINIETRFPEPVEAPQWLSKSK